MRTAKFSLSRPFQRSNGVTPSFTPSFDQLHVFDPNGAAQGQKVCMPFWLQPLVTSGFALLSSSLAVFVGLGIVSHVCRI